MSLSNQTLAYGQAGSQTAASERSTLRRAATASFMGNFVEWFDYAAYGYLAAVIAVVFFPATDKTTGLLATFAVFAISFIIRPIGGIVWGHIGDRYGRRNALSLSILIMSGATFCIALLPTYAQVGMLAPLLLLLIRLVQGFSASGEYAGAAAFLAEYAPDDKRGFYTSLVPASTAAGLLFGSLFAALLYSQLDSEQLHEWGWRIPFLLAAPLGLIGRYIRLHLQDTPKFREMEQALERKAGDHSVPIRELMGAQRARVLVAIGVTCLNAVAFYLILSYMPTYLSAEMGMTETDSFLASTVSLATYIGFIFLMGKLSDRFGRKTMLVLASLLFVGATVPLFGLLDGQGFAMILLIQIAFGLMLAMNDGTLPCFLAEIFPTRVRYSGFAFSFNTANALFGGTAPFLATWLIAETGDKLAPAWMLVAAAVVALLAMLAVRETANRALADD
ncbi:MFS transporter [Metapseudomonas furukawaii]|jgi:MHS family proline/betaine transporter-like MFS transporter|uniref:L-Proline/Glycine betaine transporter ProP n=1 Tax=Metapseudomonas furukawaii TaxID=1149133 RepID=A0AAD1FDN0_METFU|nr:MULTISPECIES: MFS transporter [Pseudomonas]ELS27344.1 L-Proline/Glycine betaine transporter ProP [Pseudomonas furukawaii]OWJ98067.1 MFS transporter [Pseudomonas sp. A46]WAG79510.1 MFS transporter [Pseudomonas furukawaii]BAU72089.1 L-Proline/Glycine betaine transporter ProP [Pseudomonas furukawaii]